MIHKFCIGFDDAQPLSYNVAQFNIVRHASETVSITPLVLETLPIERQNLTKFTYTRFLVPWVMGYKGWALFLDSDIIFVDDPIQIWGYAAPEKAVIVADTIPFERAALMLFNCARPDNRILTPEYVEKAEGLHQIGWTKNVGYFPKRWAHLVGYDEPTEDVAGIHFTQGVPSDPDIRDCEHAGKWLYEHRLMNSTKSWAELMGSSVHATTLPDGKVVPKYKAAQWHSDRM